MKLLFNDSDQDIGGHCAPDLRLHSVLARAQKTLDAQMLLDPFEEQLDLPTVLVECSDHQWRQGRVVGQKHQRLAGLWIVETDTPLVAACAFVLQMLGIVLRYVEAIQRDALIAHHTGRPVGLGRVHAPGVHAAFGAGHKESARLMQFVQPGKVQTGWPRAIATIHHVKGTRFDGQDVEHVDIAHLAVAEGLASGHVNESRNSAAQIQQGVHLHRRLGRTKWRPFEQTQAQVDRGGIQRVDGRVEFDAHRFFGIEFPGAHNQAHGQRVTGWPWAIDEPVPSVQCIGQRRARGHCAQAHVKQLGPTGWPGAIGRQANLDVAQGLAPCQLREGHHSKQIGTIQGAHTRIATVTFDDASKGLPRHVLHDLRK